MTKPYVLGFVGENANGILRWWTEQILSGFSRYGLDYKLIDMQENWREPLIEAIVERKPEFCFSFQGFGMVLKINGENFWSQNNIPFISYLGDNPYYRPSLHSAEGNGLYLLYSCKDFLETYRDVMDGKTIASIVRYGYPANLRADAIPWSARPHDVVFVKTGIDPSRIKLEWGALPRTTQEILNESAAVVLSGSNETITSICRAAFERHNLHCGSQRELLLYVCCSIDRYARATRAERMVRCLMRHDVLIIGDWSHLDQSAARARFAPARSGAELDPLYAESKIVVNTSPSVRYGIHERIMAGLRAKAAVLSDSTPHLQRTLAGCPAFVSLDIDAPEFPDQLDACIASMLADPEMPIKTASSAEQAASMFSMDAFIDAVMEHVHIEAHRRAVVDWTFPPAEAAAPTQQ
jgi:hypothetical protein